MGHNGAQTTSVDTIKVRQHSFFNALMPIKLVPLFAHQEKRWSAIFLYDFALSFPSEGSSTKEGLISREA